MPVVAKTLDLGLDRVRDGFAPRGNLGSVVVLASQGLVQGGHYQFLQQPTTIRVATINSLNNYQVTNIRVATIDSYIQHFLM